MRSKYIPAALFIGRYSPFHNGHKAIIKQALEEVGRVVVAVRECPVSENDPFDVEQRIEMIRRVYEKDQRVQVMKIPDISSVNIGRGVGYELIERKSPEEFRAVSATDIRNDYRRNGNLWSLNVPSAVAGYLREIRRDYEKNLEYCGNIDNAN